MVTLLQHTIHGSSPWGNTGADQTSVTYSSSGYVAKHPWDVVLRSMAIWSNQLHWEQHFFVSDCRPQHTTGVMSIWRFHVCFFIDCIFMIFLKSDSLNANPESRALLAPNKAPWDGIDAQVKVVYYSSLQWTVDTSHRNIDSERELQRYLFFPLRTALCSLGKRHITYDAKWQQNDPPSNVSCPSWIKQLFNLDIYIYIYILFLSYLCLNCV